MRGAAPSRAPSTSSMRTARSSWASRPGGTVAATHISAGQKAALRNRPAPQRHRCLPQGAPGNVTPCSKETAAGNERDTPAEPTPMGLRAAGSPPTPLHGDRSGGYPGAPIPAHARTTAAEPVGQQRGDKRPQEGARAHTTAARLADPTPQQRPAAGSESPAGPKAAPLQGRPEMSAPHHCGPGQASRVMQK